MSSHSQERYLSRPRHRSFCWLEIPAFQAGVRRFNSGRCHLSDLLSTFSRQSLPDD